MNQRDPTNPLWWGAIGLRLVTLTFAGGALIVHLDGYQRPALGIAVFLTMCVWSALSSVSYALRRRAAALVAADVLVTCGLVLTSPLVLSTAQYFDTTPLVTTVWAAVPPVVAGIRFGASGGSLAGIAVTVATGFGRLGFDLDVARDGVLLIVTGLLVGAVASTARRSQAALAEALRTEAATAERERLGRSIHDSVLQVLSRVRRQGAELEGPAGELARLAGEQEIALRSLISSGGGGTHTSGGLELSSALRVLTDSRVEVSTPAGDAAVPASTGNEIMAATREALTNVEQHAGPNARAWVLLEDLGSDVVVTVRDDGPGIADGVLEAAAAEGHFGIANSIRARIERLGGTCTLDTEPEAGTEWEFRVPREERAGWTASRSR